MGETETGAGERGGRGAKGRTEGETGRRQPTIRGSKSEGRRRGRVTGRPGTPGRVEEGVGVGPGRGFEGVGRDEGGG